MREDDVALLRHMLGWTDTYLRDPPDYRNYGAFDPNDPRSKRLEDLGMIRCFRRHDGQDSASLDWFYVTEPGKDVARTSFCKRRKPKAARRYRTWLRISDTWSELTFREFLTSDDPDLSKARIES